MFEGRLGMMGLESFDDEPEVVATPAPTETPPTQPPTEPAVAETLATSGSTQTFADLETPPFLQKPQQPDDVKDVKDVKADQEDTTPIEVPQLPPTTEPAATTEAAPKEPESVAKIKAAYAKAGSSYMELAELTADLLYGKSVTQKDYVAITNNQDLKGQYADLRLDGKSSADAAFEAFKPLFIEKGMLEADQPVIETASETATTKLTVDQLRTTLENSSHQNFYGYLNLVSRTLETDTLAALVLEGDLMGNQALRDQYNQLISEGKTTAEAALEVFKPFFVERGLLDAAAETTPSTESSPRYYTDAEVIGAFGNADSQEFNSLAYVAAGLVKGTGANTDHVPFYIELKNRPGLEQQFKNAVAGGLTPEQAALKVFRPILVENKLMVAESIPLPTATPENTATPEKTGLQFTEDEAKKVYARASKKSYNGYSYLTAGLLSGNMAKPPLDLYLDLGDDDDLKKEYYELTENQGVAPADAAFQVFRPRLIQASILTTAPVDTTRATPTPDAPAVAATPTPSIDTTLPLPPEPTPPAETPPSPQPDAVADILGIRRVDKDADTPPAIPELPREKLVEVAQNLITSLTAKTVEYGIGARVNGEKLELQAINAKQLPNLDSPEGKLFYNALGNATSEPYKNAVMARLAVWLNLTQTIATELNAGHKISHDHEIKTLTKDLTTLSELQPSLKPIVDAVLPRLEALNRASTPTPEATASTTLTPLETYNYTGIKINLGSVLADIDTSFGLKLSVNADGQLLLKTEVDTYGQPPAIDTPEGKQFYALLESIPAKQQQEFFLVVRDWLVIESRTKTRQKLSQHVATRLGARLDGLKQTAPALLPMLDYIEHKALAGHAHASHEEHHKESGLVKKMVSGFGRWFFK